jgi:ABC-type Fe3+/spermidine/putrescine transport system ATPase subunit
MTAALRLDRVAKGHHGRAVIRGLSLDVAPGESVALLGPSGSGKTTVLRLIAGLERPDEGDIWIEGRHVACAGRSLVPAYDRGVGLVFQDLALWPHLTVRGNVAFVLSSSRLLRDEREARIDEALRTCRVQSHLANRHPHELSGGEQQRVALARAIVSAPKVLLLDEPFSNLDGELRTELRRELVRLQRDLRLTTVYVTHDLADAEALSDRRVVLRDGRTVESR